MKSPSLPPGTHGRKSERERNGGEGPVRRVYDISSEQQLWASPCWVEEAGAGRGRGLLLHPHLEILGIDLPCRRPPHTLSASARQSLSFLSTNIPTAE